MRALFLAVLTVGLTVKILTSTTAAAECENSIVELENQNNQQVRAGYVQLCIDGVLKTLCGNGFSRVEANVVCRQLGYSEYGATSDLTKTPSFISGNFFSVSNEACTGQESTLTDCKLNKIETNCNVTYPWIQCMQADCNTDTLRLVGGATPWEGRVEVCVDGRWATVCYNKELAELVCEQLGFAKQGAQSYGVIIIRPKVTCNTLINYNNEMQLNCESSVYQRRSCAGLVVQCPAIPRDFSTTLLLNYPTIGMMASIGTLVLLELVTLILCAVCVGKHKRRLIAQLRLQKQEAQQEQLETKQQQQQLKAQTIQKQPKSVEQNQQVEQTQPEQEIKQEEIRMLTKVDKQTEQIEQKQVKQEMQQEEIRILTQVDEEKEQNEQKQLKQEIQLQEIRVLTQVDKQEEESEQKQPKQEIQQEESVQIKMNECYITQQDATSQDQDYDQANRDPCEFMLNREGRVVQYDVIDIKKMFRKKPPKIAPYQPPQH